jgi:16S rRNA (guanine966-N2)-methyltransferase
MRIVTGTYGGRVIQAPKTDATRPMTDKVRAALFDSLGPINDLTVLDVYAGSGAVGFEALSRGAKRVVAVEAGRRAIETIRANQKSLEADWGYELVAATVESWLARPQTQELKFDLIIADPPYEQLKEDILERLSGLLAADGRLVASHSSHRQLQLEGMQLIGAKVYGDRALSIFTV